MKAYLVGYSSGLESSGCLVVDLATLAWFFFHLDHLPFSVNSSDFFLFKVEERQSLIYWTFFL